MKKIIILTFALCLMFCLASCDTGSNPETQSTSSKSGQTSAEVYKFTYNGTDIAMHADAAPVIAALGEPISCTEQQSCAFEGLDKTYYYGGFYIDTYPDGDTDRINDVWFASDAVATAEGIYIGSSAAQVEAAYGADAFNGENAYVLTKGASKFTVILTDGVVSSIQYAATFDD